MEGRRPRQAVSEPADSHRAVCDRQWKRLRDILPEGQHFTRRPEREGKAHHEARETAAKRKQSKELSSKGQPGSTTQQGKPSGLDGQRVSGKKPASGSLNSDVTHQKGEAKAVGSDGEDLESHTQSGNESL